MVDTKQNSYLEKKLSAVKNPDSIFLHRYWAVKLAAADRLLSDVRRNAMKNNGDGISDAKILFDQVNNLNEFLWNFVYKLSPRLAVSGFQPTKWREINDTAERKTYYANRKVVGVFIPRHEETARIAMAVKLIGECMLEKRHTASFDDLGELSKEQANAIKLFSETFAGIAAKTNASEDIKARFKVKNNGKGN